jgi:hypothetical protein
MKSDPTLETTRGGSPWRRDPWWAILVGAIALAVYARTLAPGLVGDTDGPMFQFIGRALGVAHNPGYPLYVLLTYPFSFLPIGSLAYRINLFSALCGATAVALAFLVCRRLECRRSLSLVAALGLAFGRVFWSQSIVAEVYTLHAALIMGMLLALLTWRADHRARWFFLAIALLAAGLGHHTTIVGFIPGVIAFAWLTDRAFVRQWRTLLWSAGIVALGLLQYAFVLVRSGQPGAYVESRARTLAQLVDVMLARQFRDRLFAFEPYEVASRVAEIARKIAWPELTLAGVLLASVGGVWMLRRRRHEAVLLLPGGAAVAAFAANYSVSDTSVFVIPALLMLWLTAAVGAERLARSAARVHHAALAFVAAALLLPVVQLVRNVRVNDRSRDTISARFFDALFEVLPQRAAIVREDFIVDRMVMFKLLGDGAANGRTIELAPRDAGVLSGRFRDGVTVLGFGESAWRLRYEQLNFSFDPLTLVGNRLDELLAELDAGAIVAVAAPGSVSRQFVATGSALFGAIGGPSRLAAAASNVAIVGVRGAGGGALVRVSPFDVELHVDSNTAIGQARVGVASAIHIRTRAEDAVIRQGTREIVAVSHGVAVAIWTGDGRLAQACVLRERDGFRAPVRNPRLAVHPLRGVLPSHRIRREWTDVRPLLSTGSAIVKAPPGQTVVLYVRDETPLAPRVIDRMPYGVRVAISPVEGEARMELPDGVDGGESSADEGADDDSYYRVEVQAPDSSSGSAFLALGGVPTHAVGRVAAPDEREEAMVVGVDTEGLLRSPDAASEVLLMTRDDQAQLTGDGWSSVEADDVGAWRWMVASEARLLLPIARPEATRIRVHARRESADGPTTIRMQLNGAELPAQPLRDGWHVYEWQAAADTLQPGTNEAAVIVDRLSPASSDGVLRGVAVAEVRVLHAQP